MLSVDKFLKSYFNNNIDEYYNDLLSKLEKTNYKLYRYIPINYYRKDVKANLMHKNQYGFHSIMNQYVYHNKPSYFNDPFDSFFGIRVDSFLSVMLSQFAEIKDFRTLKEILDESGDTKDIKQVYEIIDKLKIAPEIKEYVKFIFEKIIEVLFSNPDKNIDELYVDFTKAIMNDPLKFLAFLKPFYLDNLDEEKTKEQMLLISENIGAGKLKGMLNEQFNPSTEKFVDVANMMGMKDDAHKFEKALNDGVKNFNNRIFEFNDNQFGVASLTTGFNNPLMWSHYANSHKGICIEYDLSEAIKDIASLKTLLIPVKYSNERVTVDYTLMDKIDLNNIETKGKNDILKFFTSGLYTKHDVWKYEDEWRSIIPVKQGNRNIQLGKISALYLGNKMEEATTNMIINLINKRNNGLDEISIFKMVNDISDYKLNPVQIK